MKNTLFFHGKTVDNRRFTIAGKEGLDGGLILGVSLCSKNDAFVKKVGRAKAEGRLNSKLTKGKLCTEISINKGKEIKEFIKFASSFTIFDSYRLQKTFKLYKDLAI